MIRMLRWAALASAALLVAGCGSLWPWSSSKPRIPDAPDVAAPVKARVAWTMRLGSGGVGFSAAVDGASVFAAAADGTVTRVDAATGGERWRVSAGKPLSTGVGTDGRLVVVAARDGTLIALDADGKPAWTTPMGAEAQTIPAVGQGIVVVRTADNRISAFETATGKRRWTFQRQNPPLVLRQTTAIAIYGTTVYVGLPGGRLVALGVEGGALRWEAAVSQPRGATEIERISDVVGTPRVSARDVCATSFQGKLACFDTQTGRPAWSREVASARGLDVDARLVVIVDDRDVVQAFSRTGSSIWKQGKMSLRGLSAPASLGPVVAVGDAQGLVLLLSRDDGAVAARFSLDGSPVVSAPVAAGKAAIVLTSAGTLAAVELE